MNKNKTVRFAVFAAAVLAALPLCAAGQRWYTMGSDPMVTRAVYTMGSDPMVTRAVGATCRVSK